MTTAVLYARISSLSPAMIREVDDFVEFLKTKAKKKKHKQRKFGCVKESIIMHHDFDAPLDDFKDYM